MKRSGGFEFELHRLHLPLSQKHFLLSPQYNGLCECEIDRTELQTLEIRLLIVCIKA